MKPKLPISLFMALGGLFPPEIPTRVIRSQLSTPPAPEEEAREHERRRKWEAAARAKAEKDRELLERVRAYEKSRKKP